METEHNCTGKGVVYTSARLKKHEWQTLRSFVEFKGVGVRAVQPIHLVYIYPVLGARTSLEGSAISLPLKLKPDSRTPF